jgi:mRNA-degrading endonuclease toxin of MazEF toxin-antitoxin module
VPVYSSGQRPTHVYVEVHPTSGGVQGWANALEISVQRRTLLSEWVGTVSARELAEIDAAIRLALFEELP